MAGLVSRRSLALTEAIARRHPIGRSAALGAALRPLRGATLPVLQGPLHGYRWTVSAGDHSYWIGVYEFAKMHAFVSLVAEGDVVYDIGAHAGYYTLAASRRVGRNGKVIAFEPDPDNQNFLSRHVLINHVENVKLIPAAVADSEGSARFINSLTWRGERDGKLGHLGEGSIEVRVVSLDQLLGRGEIPPPDLMKIDVEGSEHEVLLGARNLLTTARPTIFLATHGRDVRDRCLRLLAEFEYDATTFDSDAAERTSEVLAKPSRRI